MTHKYDWKKKDLLLAFQMRKEGKTWKEIADHFGRKSHDSARSALVYHGFIPRNPRHGRPSLKEVIPIHNRQGWNDVRIARKYGYHPSTVSEVRRSLGIPRIPLDRVALGHHRYKVVTQAYGVRYLSDIAHERVRIEAANEGFYGVEGPGQLKMMRWLWEHGPATSREIGEALGYSIHRASCRTAVRRLLLLSKKKLITSERVKKNGRVVFVYTAHKVWVSD